MSSRRLQARPGARRGHGEGWKLLGDDVSPPAGSVAFHRAAWVRGARKTTPLPLVGRVGWLGRLRPGRQVSFSFYFLFNLSFIFL